MDCHQYRGCTRCKSGYYGGQCGQECTNCKNGECNKNDGSCRQGCIDGYYGLRCVKVCPVNCRPKSACDQRGGTCNQGCQKGFHGSYCNNTCGNQCTDCHQYRGCTRCKSGYYGGQCEQTCTNCKDGDCNKNDGSCRQGCKDGYKGDKCLIGTSFEHKIQDQY